MLHLDGKKIKILLKKNSDYIYDQHNLSWNQSPGLYELGKSPHRVILYEVYQPHRRRQAMLKECDIFNCAQLERVSTNLNADALTIA